MLPLPYPLQVQRSNVQRWSGRPSRRDFHLPSRVEDIQITSGYLHRIYYRYLIQKWNILYICYTYICWSRSFSINRKVSMETKGWKKSWFHVVQSSSSVHHNAILYTSSIFIRIWRTHRLRPALNKDSHRFRELNYSLKELVNWGWCFWYSVDGSNSWTI